MFIKTSTDSIHLVCDYNDTVSRENPVLNEQTPSSSMIIPHERREHTTINGLPEVEDYQCVVRHLSCMPELRDGSESESGFGFGGFESDLVRIGIRIRILC